MVSISGSLLGLLWPLLTSLFYHKWFQRPPSVRQISFDQFPLHLLMSIFDGRLHDVLHYPLTLASYTVPVRRYQSLCQRHSYGAVLFTSVHESLHTTLQLANTSDRYSAYKRFSLSRFILFTAKQFICHSRRTHGIDSTPPSIKKHSHLIFHGNDNLIF